MYVYHKTPPLNRNWPLNACECEVVVEVASPQMWNHGPHSERPGTPSAKSAASASARMHSCYRSWPRREPWKWGCFTRAACATPAAVQKRQQRSFQISICIRSWTIQAEDHARGRREEQFFLSKGLPYTHESFDFVCPWMLLFWKTLSLNFRQVTCMQSTTYLGKYRI